MSRFIANVLRSRILRGDNILMSFLTETDDSKYKAEKATMLKQKKVISLEELVTPDGRLTLDLDQVSKIRKELNQRVTRVST